MSNKKLGGLRGERVRQLREREGWSQTDLAERIQTTQAQVSRIEKNQTRGNSEFARRLAVVFDVDTEYLLGITDTTKRIQKDHLSFEESELLNALRHKDAYMAIKLMTLILDQE